MKKFYPITSVCKDDIIHAFEGSDKSAEVKARLKKISTDEMKYLASKLADDYCNQLYWSSLKTIFEDRFLKNQADETK